jgi:uncharacterized membrane protein
VVARTLGKVNALPSIACLRWLRGGVAGLTLAAAAAPARAQTYAFAATGPIGLGGGNTLPAGINSLGEVTGSSELAPSVAPQFGFIYNQGVTTQLPTLGGIFSLGQGINSSGTVVGRSATSAGTQHAFA